MQKEKLEEQIDKLASMRDEIETSLKKITKCMGCKADGAPALSQPGICPLGSWQVVTEGEMSRP